ncbi:MAG: OsmC family protein [bacterium]
MSLALCQMLTFLHFVEVNEIELISYKNDVVGTLTKGKDGFSFTHFKITVDVVVASGDKEKCEKALELSKRFCLIGNSLTAEEEYYFNLNEVEKD